MLSRKFQNSNGISTLNLVVVLTSLAVVVVILLLGGEDDATSDPTLAGTLERANLDPAAIDRALDPSPYRTHIIVLERILYEPHEGSYDDAGRVASRAMELSMAVRGDGRDANRHRAWGKLFEYAGGVDAQADVGYANADLPELRTGWEEVRNVVFEPAAWFQSSTNRLTDAQTRNKPVRNPSLVRQLQDAAYQLVDLIRIGQEEAMKIGEVGVDAAVASPEARTIEQQWSTWSDRWANRLNGVITYFPRQPTQDTELNTTMAYQELSRAINELQLVPRSVATTTTVPYKYERERHFDAAKARITRAQEYLSQVQ